MSTYSPDALRRYIERQIEQFFPALDAPLTLEATWVQEAIKATEFSIRKTKAYKRKSFDYLNSGQYATFLYYLSRVVREKPSGSELATKIFLLNKTLNGIDLYHEVELPPVFLIGHTVGMVFGKASYGNYCVFHQGCTVGRNQEDRPKLASGVILYPNSSVIGACNIGENTVVSPGVQLINADTPGNCLVLPGENGQHRFKPIKEFFADRYFDR